MAFFLPLIISFQLRAGLLYTVLSELTYGISREVQPLHHTTSIQIKGKLETLRNGPSARHQ